MAGIKKTSMPDLQGPQVTDQGHNAPQEEPPEPVVEQTTPTENAYSVFSHNQKRAIVLAVTLGAFFSPLSANIYLPALNTLAADLHVTASLINLTVTTFVIFQALAPTFIGTFSEDAGRRPAYIVCFVIYIAANIGLALQNSYAALMVLRCLQSAGSSGTVAIAYAAIADIVTSSERGTYIGYTSVSSVLGPSLAPIIGGLLSEFCGWRWIFWFLLILSTTFFLILLVFLPETCRKVVGDGSIMPPLWNQTLLRLLHKRRTHHAEPSQDSISSQERRIRFPNPLSVLVIVLDKEAAVLLLSNGLIYACYYAIAASTPSQFHAIYGFNDIQVALVFLPISGGSIISAFTTGKMVDWNYRRHAKRLGFPLVKNRQEDLTDFPIEQARMEIAFPVFFMGAGAMIAYGWVLELKCQLAGPLVLMFVIGYCLIAAFNVMSVLMVDIYPGQAATATAANNLVRCLMGAAATAAVVPMIHAMGRGWAVTTLALIWLGFSPSLWMIMRKGPKWRREKKNKEERLRKEKDSKAKDSEGRGPERERGGRVGQGNSWLRDSLTVLQDEIDFVMSSNCPHIVHRTAPSPDTTSDNLPPLKRYENPTSRKSVSGYALHDRHISPVAKY